MESAILEERGFEHDRRWMLVDENGVFLSQRTIHRMALLSVEITQDGLKVSEKSNDKNDLLIPFSPLTDEMIKVSIWEDEVMGQLVGKEFDDWFSSFLGKPCRLVKMPVTTYRKLKPKYAVNGESVSFADGMPYLIIGQSSLDDLNGRLVNPVPMDRFRPNLVFKGGVAFEEDSWDKVQIGQAVFKVTKPCARCVMTTVDQQSGETSKEPLRTLATYRTVNNNVMFGQNMLLLEGEKISVGDHVAPL